MKVEVLVLGITAFFIANTYYDNKYMERLISWKKYYQMGGIAFAGLSAYIYYNKHPSDTRSLLSSVSGIIRCMPKGTYMGDVFDPFLQMTTQAGNSHVGNSHVGNSTAVNTIRQSGGTNKRCVSETKKKFVAAEQGWTCGNCKKKLPAWFEVDHTIRLENGGTNNVDNLVALCRDCHGEKTAYENL